MPTRKPEITSVNTAITSNNTALARSHTTPSHPNFNPDPVLIPLY